MNRALVFDPDTGEFLRYETAIPDQKNPGEFLLPPHSVLESGLSIPESGPNETLILQSGSVLAVPDFRGLDYYNKSTGAKVELELGQSPDSTMTSVVPGEFETGPWIEEESRWTVDSNKLAEAKSNLISKLEAIRQFKEFTYRSTVTVHSIDWDSGEKYLRNLERAISLYSTHPVSAWLDSSNNPHPVPGVAYLEAIRDAVDLDTFQAGQTLYSVKWTKRDEVNSLGPEGVKNYDPESGWPW